MVLIKLTFLSLRLHPGITIAMLYNLVWNLLDIALDFGIGELSSDKTLGSEKSVFRVDDCLTLCCDTNETLAFLGEADNRGCCSSTCRFDESSSPVIIALHQCFADEPSAFSIMRGTLPSITATAEFVVPKSIPMTAPLTFSSA